MAKNLQRIVYRSRALIAEDDEASRDTIFRASVSNNRRNGITGCLAQPDGHFVQVIEGVRERVESLMQRIRRDPRHDNVVVLGEWPVSGRLFAAWAMARPDPTPMPQQAFKVCTTDGSGVQVTSVLLGLMRPGDHLYRVT